MLTVDLVLLRAQHKKKHDKNVMVLCIPMEPVKDQALWYTSQETKYTAIQIGPIENTFLHKTRVSGSQLAKMKKSIPHISLL